MTMRMLSSWNPSSSKSVHYTKAIYSLKGMKNQYWWKFENPKTLMSQLWKQWKSWRNHQPSSCDQRNGPKNRNLYYLEERSMSQRTSNFDWKSSSYIIIHQLQDIQDNGRHWSHNLGRISSQTLLLASQKHKNTMHYLSYIAVIQNRHILFLRLWPLWPEV